MANATIEVISDGEFERGFRRQVLAVLGILVIIGAVLSSLLLIISTACQRILRVPFYLVMASWALSNLMCSFIMVFDVIVLQTGTWPFSGMMCKYYEYLIQALTMVRLYHMPLAATVACFSRKFPVWFKLWPWANVVIPIILSLYVWLAFFILAAPYIGSTRMMHFDDLSVCDYRNVGTALAVNSAILYFIPLLSSVIMLIVWACVFVRRSRVINVYIWRRENSEGMVLFIVIHVFVMSRLALVVFNNIGVFHWSSEVMQLVYYILSLVADSDYFFASFLCLFFVPIYRGILCLPCRGQPDLTDMPAEPSKVPLQVRDSVSDSEIDWAFSSL